MECNIKRVMSDINTISRFTDEASAGCMRFSYSQQDANARKFFMNALDELGISVKIDGVGNMRAKYSGSDENAPSVMVGSHIDTVSNGGKFDGVLGAVAALEVLRVFKENDIPTKNPVELIIFAEEEGSNFGVTLLGSKSLVGKLDKNALQNHIKNDLGQSGYDVIKNAGYDIDNLPQYVLKKDEVKAMLEFHIEQGGVLDHENCPVGIVQAIAGMRTYKVTLKGVSNHAGSTPMEFRFDPMVGASEIILKLFQCASIVEPGSKVVTVGKLNCFPNASNVIAGRVEFYVDIRDVEEKGIMRLSAELQRLFDEVSQKYGLNGQVELTGQSDVVHLSTYIKNTIEEIAACEKIRYRKINSGAVHDAVMLSGITNVGMIFVPSINGLSHCPEEDTELEHIKTGCDLLIKSIIKIANT